MHKYRNRQTCGNLTGETTDNQQHLDHRNSQRWQSTSHTNTVWKQFWH